MTSFMFYPHLVNMINIGLHQSFLMNTLSDVGLGEKVLSKSSFTLSTLSSIFEKLTFFGGTLTKDKLFKTHRNTVYA